MTKRCSGGDLLFESDPAAGRSKEAMHQDKLIKVGAIGCSRLACGKLVDYFLSAQRAVAVSRRLKPVGRRRMLEKFVEIDNVCSDVTNICRVPKRCATTVCGPTLYFTGG
jgi:hypothetical protein